MTTIRTSGPIQAPAPVTVESTGPRMTTDPMTSRFRNVLAHSAGALLGGIEQAASLIPGGNVVAAAIRGTPDGAGGGTATGESAEHPGGTTGENGPGTMEDAMRMQADDNMHFLQLQAQVQAENQRFTTLSNVMKARHETAKNAIGNIR